MLLYVIIIFMKKLSKEKVVNLLKEKKYTYKQLSKITGYHEKSLIRLNTQIKKKTIRTIHGNKNKKPYNFIDQNTKTYLIKMFNEKKFKTYKEFYINLNKKYSYPFLCKLLSKNQKKTQKNIITRKVLKNNQIQYKNIRYKIKNGNIKYLEEVKLHKKDLFIIYKNKKYFLIPYKKLKAKKGNTKYT